MQDAPIRPTIVFGDIHGSTYWKKVVADNPDCRYIFLGDYLDPYDNVTRDELIYNLTEIIQFKKDRSDDVILLLGNHDLHYFCKDVPGTSGRYDCILSEFVWEIFTENLSFFTYAVQEGNRIFTHAGISESWFLNDFKGDLNKNIAEQLNNPQMSSKQLRALHQAGEARGGSWCSKGGIFWADISELNDPLKGFTQYVGHNRVEKIHEIRKNGGKIVFCDCFYKEIYLKLDN